MKLEINLLIYCDIRLDVVLEFLNESFVGNDDHVIRFNLDFIIL